MSSSTKIIVVAFLVFTVILFMGVSIYTEAFSTREGDCLSCHAHPATSLWLAVDKTSVSVVTGGTFTIAADGGGGTDGGTTLKYPLDVADNNLFAYDVRSITGTTGPLTLTSTITAPSTAATYTLRAYIACGSGTNAAEASIGRETTYVDITVSVTAPPLQYSLIVLATSGGTTDPSPGTYSYDESTVVTVTAIPDAGYSFDNWELDGANVGSVNPIDVTMNADHSLQAVFSVVPSPTYNLAITSGTGGTTDPSPGTYSYSAGAVVSVTAIPDGGYFLDHWELNDVNVGDSNPIEVMMDADHTLHAVFSETELVHDIAVTGVTASSTSVKPGELVSVDVTLANEGDFSETFDVAVHYDDILIETQTGVALDAGATATLIFTWNTTGVEEGAYTISATATTIPGETDTADNTFPNGEVTIKTLTTLYVTINLTPKTLNLKSKGKWITGYIELPEGYNPEDINISTILINGVTPAEWGNVEENILMVKFDRAATIGYIRDVLEVTNDEVTLTITGKLLDEISFEGNDTIRVK